MLSIIFFILSIIFSFFAHIVLNFFFIYPIAYELAMRGGFLFALAPVLVAYYSSFTELFNQLLKENSSSNAIKSILAEKVLSQKRFVQRKVFTKKVKKKSNKRK